VSVFPGNAVLGLHTHHAHHSTLSGGTGVPLAALDGRVITAWRTAACRRLPLANCLRQTPASWRSSAAACKARTHYEALKRVRISRSPVWSGHSGHAMRFATEIGATATLLKTQCAR